MTLCPLLAQSGHRVLHCTCPLYPRKRPNSDRESGLSQKSMSALPLKADVCVALAGKDRTRASAGPAAPYIRRKQRTTMSAETTISTAPAATTIHPRGYGSVIAKAAQVDLEHQLMQGSCICTHKTERHLS